VKTIHDFTLRRQSTEKCTHYYLPSSMPSIYIVLKTIHSFTLRRRSTENRTMCASDYLSSCIGQSVKQSIQLEIIGSLRRISEPPCVGMSLMKFLFCVLTLYRELLISFRKATGQKPLRIIFYRYFTMHVRYLLFSIKGSLMPHVR
jgi:hypothetical protein